MLELVSFLLNRELCSVTIQDKVKLIENKINDRLSSGCKTALTNIVASPDAACLNPTALVSLVTGGTNASIVDPINK